MKFKISIHKLVIPLLVLNCTACKKKQSLKTTPLPNPIKIDRFEQDLFSFDIYNFEDNLPGLMKKYPEFFPLYVSNVIEIGPPDSPDLSLRLKSFVTDFTMYKVSKRVQKVFPALTKYETDLSDAFAQYAHYFPNNCIPRVISCISGFNQSIITNDSLLALCLDKYLGTNDEFYQLLHPPVPTYIRNKMHPDKIVPDALYAWLITEFEYISEPNNLLSQMIFNGRAMYCAKSLLPAINDTLLWGFTSNQFEFINKHEKNIWEYLVENKKLFITDAFTINQYIGEAPYTKDFTRESPGKTVVWIGYRIVESYMKKNKNISMAMLMQETNYQNIMNQSRYNP